MKIEDIITEKKEEEKEYVLYVDLDGVLADLETYLEKILDRKFVTLANGNWKDDEEIWEEIHALDEPQFDKLRKLPDAMKLWNYIRKYKPNILSATGVPEAKNRRLKEKWVRRNLSGYDDVILVRESKMKARYAKPHHILIDDRTKSCYPWKQAGGIAIQHRSAVQTIQKLKALGL